MEGRKEGEQNACARAADKRRRVIKGCLNGPPSLPPPMGKQSRVSSTAPLGDRSLRPRSKVTHPLYRKRSAEIAIASEARKAVAIGYHGFGHCLRPPAPGQMYGMAHQRGTKKGLWIILNFTRDFFRLFGYSHRDGRGPHENISPPVSCIRAFPFAYAVRSSGDSIGDVHHARACAG